MEQMGAEKPCHICNDGHISYSRRVTESTKIYKGRYLTMSGINKLEEKERRKLKNTK